jgi:hypothetical protein
LDSHWVAWLDVAIYSRHYQHSYTVRALPHPQDVPDCIRPTTTTIKVYVWSTLFPRNNCIYIIPPTTYLLSNTLLSGFHSVGKLPPPPKESDINWIKHPNISKSNHLFIKHYLNYPEELANPQKIRPKLLDVVHTPTHLSRLHPKSLSLDEILPIHPLVTPLSRTWLPPVTILLVQWGMLAMLNNYIAHFKEGSLAPTCRYITWHWAIPRCYESLAASIHWAPISMLLW